MEEIKSRRRKTFVRIYEIVWLSMLMLIAFLCFFAAWWYVRVYGRIGFDSVLFTLTGGLGGVSDSLVHSFLVGAALPAVIFAAAVSIVFAPFISVLSSICSFVSCSFFKIS